MQQATLQKDVRAAVEALRDRGISNPDQFLAHCSPENVLRTVEWYDQQNGRVGPGVLVAELRNGGRRPARRDELLRREAEYADSIVAWLRRNFPEFDRPVWGPHPAAVAAVIRLHHVHGKGALTKAVHGGEIRQAVRLWNLTYGDGEREGVG